LKGERENEERSSDVVEGCESGEDGGRVEFMSREGVGDEGDCKERRTRRSALIPGSTERRRYATHERQKG